jgi:alpha-galactosidase
MLDPNAAASLTLDEIAAVCDELIEAHGDALPAGIADVAVAGGAR